MTTTKILRLPELMERVGCSRTAIYAGMKSGEFPAPVKLLGRAVGWPEETVLNWLASRESARTSAGKPTTH